MATTDFAKFLESFDSDAKTRGTQWEHVCKWFLETDPVYRAQLKKVWLWDKWPGRWGPDAGIDLVAQAKDGTLWAIQAKAYGPDNAVTKKDMDSFLSESARAEFHHRLLIATTRHVSTAATRASKAAEKSVSTLLRHDLERREGLLWPTTFNAWTKGRFPKPKPKRPRPHQQKALRLALKKLKDHDRGQLILACGTGKTLTALWLHERLPSSRTLVLVPSLSLLGQTLQEWIANAKAPFATLPVCSDDTVRRADHDALMSSTLQLGYPSTTDPDDVRAFLQRRGPKVVFSTYQSSPVIADALQGTRLRFDLVIADEAHRCAGRVSNDFSTVLDNNKIRSRKRVFMTATPRYYTGRVVEEAEGDDIEIASMDDEAVFGSVFHRLDFSEAIERSLLTDYRVVIVGIDDARYRRYADQGRLVLLDGTEKTNARTLAAHIGLAKAMRAYDMKRVISFHGLIVNAAKFAKTLPNVIEWMPKRERPSGSVWATTVSGAMSSGFRKTQLDRLSAVGVRERGILTNARCLGEGIDVPTLDGITFVDPKHSQVDIVQAVGRAIRKGEGKQTATIVVPVFVDGSEHAEQVLDNSAYQTIASVLRALRDHDEELAEQLDRFRRDVGMSRTKKVVFPAKVVFDLPKNIGRSFSSAIRTKIVRLTTSSWEERYQWLLRYVEEYGTSRVSDGYVTLNGGRLGQWVGFLRRRRKRLTAQQRLALESLPRWTWNLRDTVWDEMLEQVYEYQKRSNVASLPGQKYVTRLGLEVGPWISSQRTRYRAKKISADRIKRLEAVPGWTWNEFVSKWDIGFNELKSYVGQYGTSRVPNSYKTRDGYRLGNWVTAQRNQRINRLTAKQRRQLESFPDWVWDYDGEVWKEFFECLCQYVAEHGDARVNAKYKTHNGVGLGEWVSLQRKKFKQKRMPKQHWNQLNALPGWVWDPADFDFEQGVMMCKELVVVQGHARPTKGYETPSGFKLYNWVHRQKDLKRKGILSAERIKVLEAISGWAWNANDAKWEDGFTRLKEFVEQRGDSKVLKIFVTEDGYRLGSWVGVQRGKKEKMSVERRQRLEAIPGWFWNTYDSQWEDGFTRLKEFVEQGGDSKVLNTFVTEDGYRLGSWVGVQRREKEKMSVERRQRLEGVPGWVWDARDYDERWEQGFAALVAYVKAEGNARVPRFHVAADGYSLGEWVSHQRSKKKRMPADRRARLEALNGWFWYAR